MENEHVALGLEDGSIDVERMLVEPEDEHISMDGVDCFPERIPKNDMDMEDFSSSFGGANSCLVQEEKDVPRGEVLDVIPSEVQVGYFQLKNEFSSMGEEYLLGVDFVESITNLDYGSSECLLTSVSDCPILRSSADTDAPWKSDQFRIMEVSECQNDQLNICSSELSDVPRCHDLETLDENISLKSPALCSLENIGNFCDFSSCSFQEVLSDEMDGRLSPTGDMYSSLKVEKDDEIWPAIPDVETNRLQEEDVSAIIPAQARCTETLPAQKRSRKPTQRYIDELADPILRYSKRRHEVSSSTSKGKCLGVQDNKKCHTGSKAIKFSAEETSVIAIQVPFGSIVQKECPKIPECDTVRGSDSLNYVAKSKESHVTPQNKKKLDEVVATIHVKKRNESVMVTSQKKRNSFLKESPPKKRIGSVTSGSQKRDDPLTALHRKKKDDCFTSEIQEEASGRRKHHRLWTISEVRKLIDGVSQFGVGSWSSIKKLFFPTSAHRTSVDLKDKWRNLLKASGIHEQHKRQGEKKRNMAWRPLPKPILHRVCELAAMYPYPKGRKSKILHIHSDSPDKGADITLSNYRRILRSINGN
ncbi:hypothetical protein F511_40588 [Dorcoceras hygrometricum]|uniref:Uncharacterized protein n=1 Tax=Dorcoceras hygrometricum TaxID=472368 RepID=A0A2Z7A009_9LAMI|nr:hypothetical protein F511_40588 [Dorcoceras hygrometricum]